jgi:3-oxoacyl-[acyl-carrier protein] reductase
MTNFKSKVAIVTGGTKGIGFAIAEALLKSGVSVFICGRNKLQLKSSLNSLSVFGNVAGISCDLRDEEEIDAMFAECIDRFGGLDILVNNAGVGVFGKTVEETSFIEFEYTIETNLYAVFHTCKRAIPLIRQRSGGYIFNISSLAGQNAHPKMASYNASKYALNGFTEAMMQEVRQDNIKVSLICPGSVNTTFGSKEVSDEKAWQIQPNDIAEVVVDLLKMNQRVLPSKVEIRPSNPPGK